MDPRLQEMLDHYEIRKTLSEYCNGADRVDEVRMASVYAEDSFDDHGYHKLTGAEFGPVMAAAIAESSDSMYHLLGQSLIAVDGGTAGAETYFIAVALSTRADGVRECSQLGGRFVDKLVQEDGHWKIKNRVVVRDWTIALPIETDWDGALALTPGLRTQDDPSFAALGTVHSGEPTLLAST
jgi:SnoaL-like domain